MSDALLTTCASAGATLVAIIGGLAVSRHIAIESDIATHRRNLSSSLVKKSRALEARRLAQRNLDYLLIGQMLQSPEAFEYLHSCATDGFPPQVDELIVNHTDLARFDRDLVLNVAAEWYAELKAALNHPAWHKVQASTTWSDFRQDHRPPVNIQSIWLNEFRRIKEPLRGDPYFVEQPALDGTLLEAELGGLRKLRDEASREYDLAEMQLAIFQAIMPDAKRSRGLFAAFVILAMLTLTTVVIPILYLTPSTVAGPLTMQTITAIFLGGVAVLFGYMAYQIVRIRRDSV